MGERLWRVCSKNSNNNNDKDTRPRLFTGKNQKAVVAASDAICTRSLAKLAVARQNHSMALSSQEQQQPKHQLKQQLSQEPQDHARLEQETATTVAATRRRLVKHGAQRANHGRKQRSLGALTFPSLIGCVALVFVVAASLLLVRGSFAAPTLADESNSNPTRLMQDRSAADTKAAIEAELNSILQQQELNQETNSKLLSEAIISRLMLGNLTDIEEGGTESGSSLDASSSSSSGELGENGGESVSLSAPDAMRLRRVLSFLQNYEINQADPSGHYPVLPAIQAATIKRASAKMGSYLKQQTQHHNGGQRQLNGYGRVNSFDFGLGKRPDSSVSGNILRFGDSAGGHIASVSGSGLGKRPSAHRYDFGLGKRVASPAYPRYDFGLGKRAPNSRIRYDFGLGK